MIMREVIERVRFPDQASASYDERIPYDEVVEGLMIGINSNKNQLQIDLQETLDELSRLWTERQKAM